MASDSKGVTQFYLLPTHEPYLPLYSPAAEYHRPLAGTLIAIAWAISTHRKQKYRRVTEI